jgi:hypothetical protein
MIYALDIEPRTKQVGLKEIIDLWVLYLDGYKICQP